MEKHKAIFKGEKYKKLYEFDRGRRYRSRNSFWASPTEEPVFYSYHRHVDYVMFLEKEVDYPPIEKDEVVYISEIDQEVTIVSRVRNLDGGYIYTTNYVVEVFEDEETESSRLKSLEEQEHYNKQSKTDNEVKEKHIQKHVEILTDYNKKWYQFWK
jgi:hypothetical protein